MELKQNTSLKRSLHLNNFASFLEKDVTSESLPCILSDLGLLHLFVRRVLLHKLTSDIIPSRDEQVSFQSSFFKSNNIVDKSSLESWLLKNNIQESEMSLHLYRSLKLEMFKESKFMSEVEPFFIKHKSNFDYYYFSLLRTSSRDSINELYFRLVEDEDTFSSLSTQFSSGSESQSNGYIGPRPFSEIHPEFAERLRISKPGQLWSPFKVDNFWCIIRLERLIPASLNQQTSVRILNHLFETWISSEVESAISSFDLPNVNSPDFTSHSKSANEELS